MEQYFDTVLKKCIVKICQDVSESSLKKIQKYTKFFN